MSYYMYKVTPPRPTFATDMTASEAAIMDYHIAYWTDLLDKGIAVTFGPVADPAGLYGMAVVESHSEQEVRVLASGDPVICTGLFTYEVFTMPQAIARPHRYPSSVGAQHQRVGR